MIPDSKLDEAERAAQERLDIFNEFGGENHQRIEESFTLQLIAELRKERARNESSTEEFGVIMSCFAEFRGAIRHIVCPGSNPGWTEEDIISAVKNQVEELRWSREMLSRAKELAEDSLGEGPDLRARQFIEDLEAGTWKDKHANESAPEGE
jgi:hypothetical protein